MRENTLNIALMLLSLLAACLLPFELLILAYAFLGPAHYLTEISWLRQKGFFLRHRAALPAFLLLALGYLLAFNSSPWLGGLAVLAALCLAAVIAAPDMPQRMLPLFWLLAVTVLALNIPNATMIALFAVLVPTLIHVSLFTFLFMVGGAQRSRRAADWLPPLLYLVCFALVLVMPLASGQALFGLDHVSSDYFGNVSAALGHLIGGPMEFSIRFCALLSFAYTYHYLNWFVKVRTIRWHEVPVSRLLLIAFASIGSGAIYLYDYAAGFAVLATLSILHVFLEFPLNAISIAGLRLRRSA